MADAFLDQLTRSTTPPDDVDLAMILVDPDGGGETTKTFSMALVRERIFDFTADTLGTITRVMRVTSQDPDVIDVFGISLESSAWEGTYNDHIVRFGFGAEDPDDHSLFVIESRYQPYAEQTAVTENMWRVAVNGTIFRPYQFNVTLDAAAFVSQYWLRATNFSIETHSGTQMIYTAFNGAEPDEIHFGVDLMPAARIRTNRNAKTDSTLEFRQPAVLETDNLVWRPMRFFNQVPIDLDGNALNAAKPIVAITIDKQLATDSLSIEASDKASFRGGMRITDEDTVGANLSVLTAAGVLVGITGWEGVRYATLLHTGTTAVLKNNSGSIEMRRFDDTVLAKFDAGTLETTISALRINANPTSGAITPTHYFTINFNGTTYRVPCVAA